MSFQEKTSVCGQWLTENGVNVSLSSDLTEKQRTYKEISRRCRMPRGSEERTAARREEIILACAELYKRMSFKDITMKEIGNTITVTRTSIYNYFQTKEEIFLALLQREYELWIQRLKEIQAENESLTRAEFAAALAHSLEDRKNLLKIMSMNHYDMEENSRLERLIEFKTVYGQALAEVRNCLDKFFPEMTDADKQDFVFSFFPFLFGIYPYTMVTEKQKEAMRQAKVDYVYLTIYEITYAEIKKLLGL
jgi:AcrR family transcriptional regulator